MTIAPWSCAYIFASVKLVVRYIPGGLKYLSFINHLPLDRERAVLRIETLNRKIRDCKRVWREVVGGD